MPPELIAALADAARTAAHRTTPHHPCGACAQAEEEAAADEDGRAPGTGRAPGRNAPRPPTGTHTRTAPRTTPCTETLAARQDGTVVRHGPVVAKAHAPDTDPAALAVRVAVAAHPLLHGVLLPPLPPPPSPVPGVPVTLWPHGTPVDPEDPDSAPWSEAGRLVARLHRVAPQALAGALPGPLPAMRGPAKAARAVERMRAAGAGGAAADAVVRAWRQLPAWARAETPHPGPAGLCHGDLHLGQLVRHPAGTGDWLLIDVDDLGLGAPAWDLARPAAWYAAGLLDPADWTRFLAAYREAGGPAVPPEGDPWPQLDVPARALTVQTAAVALAKCAAGRRAPDEAELAMVESCTRIAALPPGMP